MAAAQDKNSGWLTKVWWFLDDPLTMRQTGWLKTLGIEAICELAKSEKRTPEQIEVVLQKENLKTLAYVIMKETYHECSVG